MGGGAEMSPAPDGSPASPHILRIQPLLPPQVCQVSGREGEPVTPGMGRVLRLQQAPWRSGEHTAVQSTQPSAVPPNPLSACPYQPWAGGMGGLCLSPPAAMPGCSREINLEGLQDWGGHESQPDCSVAFTLPSPPPRPPSSLCSCGDQCGTGRRRMMGALHPGEGSHHYPHVPPCPHISSWPPTSHSAPPCPPPPALWPTISSRVPPISHVPPYPLDCAPVSSHIPPYPHISLCPSTSISPHVASVPPHLPVAPNLPLS